MKVAIIGAGAAGFFSAISVKEHHPNAEVILFERSSKTLAKVKISGGGRCNVTNGSLSIKELSNAYPRGKQLMKKALQIFSTGDTWQWFESRGVPLKTEKDGRVFPRSDNSDSIINCLTNELKKTGIIINLKEKANNISPLQDGSFEIITSKGKYNFDKIIVTTGGSPKIDGFNWLAQLGIDILPPVPSLFTFNMPSENITTLMGVVAQNVQLSIPGQKLNSSGPLLITHWGMSGPAVLKLSAFGARIFSDWGYQLDVVVNWINTLNQEEVRAYLLELCDKNPVKKISSIRPYDLPSRLWHFLLQKGNIPLEKRCDDLGKKGIYKIVALLCNDIYNITGKTTFKEEFVTCGGVDLKNINTRNLESIKHPGLYFAGEVLDIDGITGGYNFQAAWSTGFIAGKLS